MSSTAKRVAFEVKCGDWMYPCRDSTTRFKYDVEYPMVAMIFQQKEDRKDDVDGSSSIGYHLDSFRYLECEIIHKKEDTYIFRLLCLRNCHEEDFKVRMDFDIPFTPDSLDRANELWPNGFEGEFINTTSLMQKEWWAILFASILVQAFREKVKLPKGITFRKARVPEIEALGKW